MSFVVRVLLLYVVALAGWVHAFMPLRNSVRLSRIPSSGGSQQRRSMVMQAVSERRQRPPPITSGPTNTGSMKDISSQMKDMRSQMPEEVRAYMDAMRGAALSDFDVAQGEMRLIDVDETDEEKLPLVYEPEVLGAYYAKRPQLATQRMFQLAGAFSSFFFSLISDSLTNKMKENEVKRAANLREIITSLGPFYIKLGQALSIRPDILSPLAMVELQRLCDKVPSYDSKIAFAIMEKELGRPISEVYSEISPEPLAAASLGQVYKAKLRSTGADVAVKVQRPGVLETVSLDLYLVRQLGYALRKLPFLQDRTDVVALLDEFAYRFYEELDYVKECQNGIRIKEDMKSIKQVVVPFNYPEYTTRRVFTAEWIEGEKLSQSTAGDVQTLVNAGVLAYLTQLLDKGFFHADPHPGNLIRTPEGKLAILDFGLMTEITDDQKFGIIEAISHLVHRDYSRIGEDFKRLDFIPQNIDVQPIIPALSKVFDAALSGGGAKSINFQDLAGDLAQITFDYPFRIPPYFALIIRAIGVLEGIALVGNPDFAIVDEAYPYISKRLLTDESPRLRAALRYMVYGKSNVFDVERLIDLLQAFETFAEIRDDKAGKEKEKLAAAAVVGMTAPPDSVPPTSPSTPLTSTTVPSITRKEPVMAIETYEPSPRSAAQAREALKFLFGKDGDFFREFLQDEVVRGVDCLSRDAARELANYVGLRGPNIPQFLRAVSPTLSNEDRQVVNNTRRLLSFLLGDTANTPYNPAQGLFGLRINSDLFSSKGQAQLQKDLLPVFRELGPEMRIFGLTIVGRLTEKLASRVLRYTSEVVLGNYYGDAQKPLVAGQLQPSRNSDSSLRRGTQRGGRFFE